MSTIDRKAELEKKRAKLAALREVRLKKDHHSNDNNNSANDILKDLGIFSNGNNNDIISIDELLKPINSPQTLKSTVIIQPPKQLSLSTVRECSIVPREIVSYSKYTQIYEIPYETPRNIYPGRELTPQDTPGMHSMEWYDDFRTAFTGDFMHHDVSQLHSKLADGNTVNFFRPDSPSTPPPGRQLTIEEKDEIVESESFQGFFSRASRLIERAMDEKVDIFVDYSGADRDTIGAEDLEMLKVERDFMDEKWSSNRCVVSLDWSSIHPELLLAAYSSEDLEGSHEAKGVCLLWNMKYKKTSPEYVFTYQAEITTATLSEFNPSLVFGGTHGGQIVLWDSRVNRRTPVQHTPLGGLAHTEPIKALIVRGSQNAHNLISVSSDGKMCSWSLDMLGKPQETLDLSFKTKSVAPTSLVFFPNDLNNFMVGSLDGIIYSGARHGKKSGLIEQYPGRHFPITSIIMSSCGAADNSMPPIILSTSMDCSVKLWSKNEQRFPIFSFDDRIDYIFDSDWSPIHPAVFATVDIGGQLDIWNLNNDPEVPTASAVMPGDVALNSCKFDRKGSRVAVGDDVGRVRVFNINEKLAVPRPDDWSKLTRLVEILTTNVSEQQEYDAMHNLNFHPLITA